MGPTGCGFTMLGTCVQKEKPMFAKIRVPMSTCATAILLALAGQAVRAAAIPKIVLQNDSVEYALSAEGKNLSFLAKGHAKEYLVGPGQQAVVTLKKGGTS